MSSLIECSSTLDNVFGPRVATCRRDLDFTLWFEELFLSILPSVLFLLLAPIRVLWLSRSSPLKPTGIFLSLRLVVIAAFGVLQIVLAVAWSRQSSRTSLSVGAAALSAVDPVMMIILSWKEHKHSIAPSFLLTVYLFVTSVFGIFRVRTLWLFGLIGVVPPIFTASFALRLVILSLESWPSSKQTGGSVPRGPEDTSNIFSLALCLWMNKLIVAGNRKFLDAEDLYPMPGTMQAHNLHREARNSWDVASRKAGKWPLFLALWKCLRWPLLAPILPRLCLAGFNIVQPVLLNQTLDFIQRDPNKGDRSTGYALVVAYGVTYLGIAVSQVWYWHRSIRLATTVRGSLIFLIYKKTLGSSITAVDEFKAVTLMGNDVERVIQGSRYIHETWAVFVEVALATWLLERQLGLAIIGPLLLTIVCGAVSVIFGKIAKGRQSAVMERVNKRISVTTAVLSSMKEAKMSGLTDRIMATVQGLRLDELKIMSSFRQFQVGFVVLAYIPVCINPIVAFCSFISIAYKAGLVLDNTRIFTAQSLLSRMAVPLNLVFQVFPELVTAASSMNRIQAYLRLDGRHDYRIASINQSSEPGPNTEHAEKVSSDTSDLELHPVRINSDIPNVVEISDGCFGWDPANEPNLRNVNIQIPRGKLTIITGAVGSGKSTLVKAMMGETPIARGTTRTFFTKAAYCDQTPWITNSTVKSNIIGFSEVDEVFYHRVIHACALEEDLTAFPNGDQETLGSKGTSLSGGQKRRLALARAIYSRNSFFLFDDVLGGLDAITENQVVERLFSPHGILSDKDMTVVLVTHAERLLQYADQVLTVLTDGSVDSKQQQPQPLKSRSHDNHNATTSEVRISAPKAKTQPEASDKVKDNRRQLRDPGLWRFYFRAIGWGFTTLFFFISMAYTFFWLMSQIWLKFWAAANEAHPDNQAGYNLGLYVLWQALALITVGLLARHSLIAIVVKSGKRLHLTILKTVMKAPLSFFSEVDSGKTLNRFSQDMQLIDAELPMALMNAIAGALFLVGQMCVNLNASYWIAITYPAILLVLYFLQKHYLRVSKQLRLMDLEAKSPLYSQFVESLGGLATIRAFCWSEAFETQSLQRLEDSQRPFYLLLCLQRWLVLILDLITLVFGVILVTLIVTLRDHISPGFAGVALSSLTTFSAIMMNVVTWYTQLEAAIGSIWRIKTFEQETIPEHLHQENNTPPSGWPHSGGLEICNLTASYKKDSKNVINGVNMSIKGGDKIAVCGRTGSGKSSLLLCLLHMLEFNQGTIQIDGLDLSLLQRDVVRSRLSCVTQAPFFLKGTIRFNLDPWEVASDEEILNALKKVDLTDIITSHGGLSIDMDASKQLSHGQQQLFCLARVIINPGKIIMLDEVTSSIDHETEIQVQRLIKEEFEGSTVIAVAHHLDTIFDFDKIALFQSGHLLEYDTPGSLLDSDSAFKSLYSSYQREDL